MKRSILFAGRMNGLVNICLFLSQSQWNMNFNIDFDPRQKRVSPFDTQNQFPVVWYANQHCYTKHQTDHVQIVQLNLNRHSSATALQANELNMNCKQNRMNINLILAYKLAGIGSVILFQFSMLNHEQWTSQSMCPMMIRIKVSNTT